MSVSRWFVTTTVIAMSYAWSCASHAKSPVREPDFGFSPETEQHVEVGGPVDVYLKKDGKPKPAIIYFGPDTASDAHEERRQVVLGGLAQSNVVVLYTPARLFTPKTSGVRRRVATALGAIAFLHGRAEQYEMDPHRLFLMGHSEGGLLASLAATALPSPMRRRVRGVIAVNPLTDLAKLVHERPLDPEVARIIARLRADQSTSQGGWYEYLHALSPRTQLDPTVPPHLIFRPLGARGLLFQQERYFCDALRDDRLPCQLVEAERLSTEAIRRFIVQNTSPDRKPQHRRTARAAPVIRYHLNKIEYPKQEGAAAQPETRAFYGDHRRNYVEIYRRSGTDRRPAVIYVHGGGWREGSTHSYEAWARRYMDLGFVALLVEYRLANPPETDLRTCVGDVADALRYIVKNARRWSIDVNRLTVMGESAGAHLAAMALTKLEDRKGFKAVVLNSLPSDLAYAYRLPEFKRWEPLFGHVPSERLEAYLKRISPVHQVRAPYPATLLFQGEKDQVTPTFFANRFEKRLTAENVPLTVVTIENAVHPVAPTGGASMRPSYEEIDDVILEFIRKNVGPWKMP